MEPATVESVAPARAAGAAPPPLSVVVPVHDGGPAFRRCLSALGRSTWRDFELVVVDDASRDDSAAIAAEHGARIVRLPERRGPAAARNRGARQARGEVLFFLDADCEIAPDALERAARALEREPEVDALFGSYDDRPDAPGLVSQFKNLFHHWMHQRGAGHASTFWAGCGAVRRGRFLALGGFDERRYPRPSVEDIELGYRLGEAGGAIRLVPEVQARHLKRWTLGNLVRTDFAARGMPWAELLFERPGRAGALNVGPRERLAVAAGATALAALPFALLTPWALAVAAVGALPLHALYGACCAGAFAAGAARAVLGGGRRRAA